VHISHWASFPGAYSHWASLPGAYSHWASLPGAYSHWASLPGAYSHWASMPGAYWLIVGGLHICYGGVVCIWPSWIDRSIDRLIY
jgi:phosphoribulokinase